MADQVILQETAADVSRKVAAEQFAKLIGGNDYQETRNEYSATNKDALSDGDAKGRGEVNGKVGTSIDQVELMKLSNINIFSSSKPYKNPETN